MHDFLAKPLRVKELVDALSRCHPLGREAAGPEKPPSAHEIPVGRTQLDKTALGRLKNLVCNDAAALAELIESFIADTAQLITDIKRALATDNSELLHRAGHTFKSSSRDFGATALADLGSQLECAGKEKNLQGTAPLIDAAEYEFGLVTDALGIYLRGCDE